MTNRTFFHWVLGVACCSFLVVGLASAEDSLSASVAGGGAGGGGSVTEGAVTAVNACMESGGTSCTWIGGPILSTGAAANPTLLETGISFNDGADAAWGCTNAGAGNCNGSVDGTFAATGAISGASVAATGQTSGNTLVSTTSVSGTSVIVNSGAAADMTLIETGATYSSGSDVSFACVNSGAAECNRSTDGDFSAVGAIAGASVAATGAVTGATVAATGQTSGNTLVSTTSVSGTSLIVNSGGAADMTLIETGATYSSGSDVSFACVNSGAAECNMSTDGDFSAVGAVSSATVAATGAITGASVAATGQTSGNTIVSTTSVSGTSVIVNSGGAADMTLIETGATYSSGSDVSFACVNSGAAECNMSTDGTFVASESVTGNTLVSTTSVTGTSLVVAGMTLTETGAAYNSGVDVAFGCTNAGAAECNGSVDGDFSVVAALSAASAAITGAITSASIAVTGAITGATVVLTSTATAVGFVSSGAAVDFTAAGSEDLTIHPGAAGTGSVQIGGGDGVIDLLNASEAVNGGISMISAAGPQFQLGTGSMDSFIRATDATAQGMHTSNASDVTAANTIAQWGDSAASDFLKVKGDGQLEAKQTTTGTPMSWRVPTAIADSTITLPTCATSVDAGKIIYVDDSNDTTAAELCVCRAGLDDATYVWIKIADNLTGCIDP